jgi:hypothetical protein
MSDQKLANNWHTYLEAAVCERCDWSYLLPSGALPVPCPHCFQTSLTSMPQDTAAILYNQPPELMLPFTLSNENVTTNIQQFVRRIWFAPRDLTPENLQTRLQRVYLPMWLVDSDVQATWQAEVGFDYTVVSHQDSFDQNRGGWVSREVTETRIRWEPRVGRLTRTYANTAAPALEEHFALQKQLGQYSLNATQPYEADAIANSFVCLPNRQQSDAWPDAIPPLQANAAEECRQASRADHFRNFRWKADYGNLNWTLLLLPMATTYYLDDDQNPQPVLIHGQAGRISGPQRASMKRAQQTALMMMGVAVAICVLSLVVGGVGLLVPPLLMLGIIGLVVAISLGLLAIAPIVIAWQFNRSNKN